MKYILGIDLGTTSMKAALFDENLRAVGHAKVDYGTEYPAPGWAEQDANHWWAAMNEAVGRLYTASGAPSPSDLEVIAIDAMTPTMVPVDVEGRALRNALIWLDRRAEAESALIVESLGQAVFNLGGNAGDPSNFAPKVRWLKENEPEIYAAADKFLFPNGYLVHRLTGVFTADTSNCGMSQLCDTAASRWNDTLIDGSGLHREKFPEIFESTDIIGSLTAVAAEELGLDRRTKVIAGAMDNVAAVMGTGTVRDLDLCISAGTAANANLCVAEPHFDPSFQVYRHIIPGHFIHAGAVDYGGAGYKWFADLIDEKDYAALDGRADAVVPGKRPIIFLPYMVGQRAPLWNSNTRGVLFGLDPSMSDGEMARAFMEGNVYGVKKILELMKGLGASPAACRLTGGCADSAVYSQIFADILGIDILRVGEADTATLGIAMAGAYAAGFHSDFESMLDAVHIRATQTPNAANGAYYEKAFGLFDRLYKTLVPAFDELGALARPEV